MTGDPTRKFGKCTVRGEKHLKSCPYDHTENSPTGHDQAEGSDQTPEQLAQTFESLGFPALAGMVRRLEVHREALPNDLSPQSAATPAATQPDSGQTSEGAREAYRQGYLDGMDKRQPKYLLGFDPLNLPVEDEAQLQSTINQGDTE